MTVKKTVNVRVRRRSNSIGIGGRPATNLPDIHTDENLPRVPPLPDTLKDFPNSEKIWKDICGTLIHRGKLKYNHLQVVALAVQWTSLANCTTYELEKLGYITFVDDICKPALHMVKSKITDEMLKCYNTLTLDPKTEIYDCMAQSGQQGRARVDIEEQYDDF